MRHRRFEYPDLSASPPPRGWIDRQCWALRGDPSAILEPGELLATEIVDHVDLA